ncbi:MAG: hypothetical protein KDI82_01810 [Gammaproteobacteria bacterium]|nr:hypothetical protein [Gammaproteobacteria bacterium]
MRAFRKLPGYDRSPAGLERRILRRLPRWLAAATAVPLLCHALARYFPAPDDGQSIQAYQADVIILAIAFVVTAWTAALTVAIGCLIVVLMKGPAYVADAYTLPDSEQPRDRGPA